MNGKEKFLIVAAALLIWGGHSIIPNDGFAQTGVFVPEMVNVDEVFSNFMNEWNIPGGSVAVVKDGRLVYARGFGYADKESNELAQPYHLFRIASISKPITSIAIMKLIDEGLIDVDAKVFGPDGILNGSEYTVILDPRVENITVRHLLHHTAGWGFINGNNDPTFFNGYIAEQMAEEPPVGPVTIIKFMLTTQTLDNEPGTNYFYSNVGFCILGRVIEQVSGKSYENYVKTELLNPLGISEMQLGRNLYENKAPNEVKYYNFPGASLANSVYGTGERVPWPYGGFNIEAMDAQGGWIASAIDLTRLLVAVDGFDTKVDILSRRVIQLMTTPSTENSYYGLGWGVNQWDNWWHIGGQPGTTSIFVRTSGGLGWAVLFNTRPSNTRDFMLQMENMVWEVVGGIDSWPTHDLFQLTTEDVNGDGIVNVYDIREVAHPDNYNKTVEAVRNKRADVNTDDNVDIKDLIAVAEAVDAQAAAPSLIHQEPDVSFTSTEVQTWLHEAKALNVDEYRISLLQRLLPVLAQRKVLPKETALLANYPNPFNPETWIPYQLASPTDVAVEIHASNGRLVRTLALGQLPAGVYQEKGRAVYWDGKNEQGEPVASGVYFYTLKAPDFSATKKMLIRK